MASRCLGTPTWRLALVACLLSGCGRARKEPLLKMTFDRVTHGVDVDAAIFAPPAE